MSKTIVVAVGNNQDPLTFDHAVNITTPKDKILFVSAIKENGGRDEFLKSAMAKYDRIAAACKERNRQCEYRQLFFHEPGSTAARTKRSEIAQTLCIAAQMNNADTLVLGWRGLGRVDRTIFGSVSDQCTKICPVSVAVVKQPSLDPLNTRK